MRGPRGERLGDPLEGEDPRERPGVIVGGTELVVVDEEGVTRPGWALRAGDFIVRTDYDHGCRVVTARVSSLRPLPLRLRVRRWLEGRR